MNDAPGQFRAGMIAIAGTPNVGKSTFLNRVLGQKVVIVSDKPQTTRDKVAGILTDDDSQIVFLDTPGLVTPRDLLHEALVATVHEAVAGVDAVMRLRDASRPTPKDDPTPPLFRRIEIPVIEVWNKIDRLGADKRRDLEAQLAAKEPGTAFAISALTGEGVDALLKALRALLPQGPPLYSPDDLSDRDLRYFAAELVREKIFEMTEEEIPYSVAVRTEEFVEHPEGKHYVLVMIYVEHESQKGMIIGRGGALLKRIGQAARVEIEELADHPIYLELRVKVRKKWTKHVADLKQFGYRVPKKGRRKGKSRFG